MDCSPPGFSIRGILQARVLEWVAISFSRGSSRTRDRTWDSHIVGRRFTVSATREILLNYPFKNFFIYIFVWLCWVLVVPHKIFSCGMRPLCWGMWNLVPWPSIKSRTPALGAQSLSQWTTRKVPIPVPYYLLFHYNCFFLYWFICS